MTEQQNNAENEQLEGAVIEQSDESSVQIESVQNRRKRGRPARSNGPAFPADEVDHLLVHGEPDDQGVVQYPSHREIAERFGVAPSTISGFAQHHNCLERRRKVLDRVREVSDMKLADRRAEQVALTTEDLVQAIDEYVVQFSSALREGRVRCDSPADFNQLARLRAFLLGGADSRPEQISGLPTLEVLQQRRKEFVERMASWTPDKLGYTPPRDDTEQSENESEDKTVTEGDNQASKETGSGYLH